MYFQAYSGSEPYIFVSYCHKDRDRVYPIIEQLHNEGYRIWYDEGIPATEEWRGVINRHIVNCGIFMIFVTNNAMASHEVVKECTFAINMKKKLHIICLDDVPINEIDENLIADFTNNQCVLAYNLHSSIFSSKLREPLAKYLAPSETKPQTSEISAEKIAPVPATTEAVSRAPIDILKTWKNTKPLNLVLACIYLVAMVVVLVCSWISDILPYAGVAHLISHTYMSFSLCVSIGLFASIISAYTKKNNLNFAAFKRKFGTGKVIAALCNISLTIVLSCYSYISPFVFAPVLMLLSIMLSVASTVCSIIAHTAMSRMIDSGIFWENNKYRNFRRLYLILTITQVLLMFFSVTSFVMDQTVWIPTNLGLEIDAETIWWCCVGALTCAASFINCIYVKRHLNFGMQIAESISSNDK